MASDPHVLIDVELTPSEREVLRCGIVEWSGPARCTEEMALAIGFASVADLFDNTRRLVRAIDGEEALTRDDWRAFATAPTRTTGCGTLEAGTYVLIGSDDSELAVARVVSVEPDGLVYTRVLPAQRPCQPAAADKSHDRHLTRPA